MPPLCDAPSRAAAPKSPSVHFRIDTSPLPASVTISRFEGENGVGEYHLVVRPRPGRGGIADDLECVSRAYRSALESLGLDMNTAVLRRFFCSDLPNQAAALRAHQLSDPRSPQAPCAVSWVCQPPMPPVKTALWAYHLSDPGRELDKVREGATLTLQHGRISHHWTTGAAFPGAGDSYKQTRSILKEYDAFLRSRGLAFADNVLRTWFFVQNVDANYHGLVAARREFFAERGLTPQTHFVASTGVQGGHADIGAAVAMDAYAISGIQPGRLSTSPLSITSARRTSTASRSSAPLPSPGATANTSSFPAPPALTAKARSSIPAMCRGNSTGRSKMSGRS